MKLPLYYVRIDIDKHLSFHLRTVKNPVRLLYRHYWYEARRNDVLDKIDLDLYIRRNKIKRDFGTDNIIETSEKYYRLILSRLKKYEPDKIFPYPKILEKYLEDH